MKMANSLTNKSLPSSNIHNEEKKTNILKVPHDHKINGLLKTHTSDLENEIRFNHDKNDALTMMVKSDSVLNQLKRIKSLTRSEEINQLRKENTLLKDQVAKLQSTADQRTLPTEQSVQNIILSTTVVVDATAFHAKKNKSTAKIIIISCCHVHVCGCYLLFSLYFCFSLHETQLHPQPQLLTK